VVINEVKPTEGGNAGFIELYNRSAETLGLAGYQIIDSQGSAFSIPGGTNPAAARLGGVQRRGARLSSPRSPTPRTRSSSRTPRAAAASWSMACIPARLRPARWV
jgi:hypothetical protein